jgi:hypothetical protein
LSLSLLAGSVPESNMEYLIGLSLPNPERFLSQC